MRNGVTHWTNLQDFNCFNQWVKVCMHLNIKLCSCRCYLLKNIRGYLGTCHSTVIEAEEPIFYRKDVVPSCHQRNASLLGRCERNIHTWTICRIYAVLFTYLSFLILFPQSRKSISLCCSNLIDIISSNARAKAMSNTCLIIKEEWKELRRNWLKRYIPSRRCGPCFLKIYTGKKPKTLYWEVAHDQTYNHDFRIFKYLSKR